MGSAQLTGRVIFKGDPGYTEAVKNWNPYVDVCPLVFVFAQNSYDVSNAIKWAREKNVPLRVRSGRHALDKNLSTVSDGIVIDVSDMNNVFLDEKNAVATVQTGIHVGPLVKGLAREGFMAPFGDSPTVGIGGITMGGGFGVLSRSIGLISDNLLALKMVDAKGRIIQANHSRNEDLLWASRGGGGGNFGYNTQYTFKVHRAPKTATVFNIIWPWEQLETVFKAWQKWAPFTDERLGCYLEIYSKVNGLCHAEGLFLGSKPELIQLLKPLLNAGTPAQTVIKTLYYPDCIDFLDPDEPIPGRSDQSVKFSSAWALKLWPEEPIAVMRQFLEKATGTETNFFFINWGGAISRVPSSETAFYWRRPLFYTEWTASWKNKSQEASNLASVERVRQLMKPYVTGSYVNVPDQNIENFGKAYYGSNFARLQRIKAKYDPENVFRFPQSIPPSYK
ncbi:FAD-binding oxidoreductase [Bacillus velezensis]|uniref:FAD-binding oxidoreductase n=1 Tax=Bacillus amyloliquefaciens group TaxID=1938374 RepID=UPI00049EF66F|nr:MULTISPECIES: FAD-binding oxidoreductase [Bacillus amyloliquefaciens group]KDN93878.1 FAD-binding protein [Bacillus amyloliquefaciens]MBW8602476.1 FAD-binding oxidoreductase [Bacillus amyloliquefaciens]MEC2287790.1 FAD-binding oxidoreductase [Bacillus velezensis]MEC2423913.1 FAD-binding oxidoreductase [Bacillus velezensis]MEE3675273.1 FAD-binding oxidoreductase [Bacillus velezensis]